MRAERLVRLASGSCFFPAVARRTGCFSLFGSNKARFPFSRNLPVASTQHILLQQQQRQQQDCYFADEAATRSNLAVEKAHKDAILSSDQAGLGVSAGVAATLCSRSAICGQATTALQKPLRAAFASRRTYLHFGRTLPEDFELPSDTMPKNVAEMMSKNPKEMDFFENYWYWRLRGESTILDPESLPKKSYKQLARDMGMQVVSEETEHMVGLLELYEHLKTATFVGPFGTIEKPVLCPSVTTDRIVGCTGGSGDREHVPLWFRCREGFLYRCGECDQIFMLVRVFYSLPDGKDPFPVDPDVDDVFDAKLLEKGQKMWNCGEYVQWPAGHNAYSQLFLEGKWGNAVPQKLAQELKAIDA